MLNDKIINNLKKLAKDNNAFEELKTMFENQVEETEKYAAYLELLESAIRNDYDSILITELELEKPGPRIVYVNDGFEKMTGYSRDEVIGQTPRMLQGEKTDPEVLKKLRKALQNGNSFFGQTVNYRKDGSEYINQWDIHPLLNKDGEVTHWVSYQHDITERKRAEQKMVDVDRDQDEVYQDAKSTFIDFAPDGSILDANKAFREMLGYRKEELVGKMIWELTPAKFTAGVKALFGETLFDEIKKNNTFKLIFRRKNGLPVQVELAMKLISTNGKKIVRGFTSNVSLRKNVMKILQKRNDDFNRLFDRKNDFNYGVKVKDIENHEINWISDGFEKLTGLNPDEFKGKNGFLKLVHPDDHKILRAHFEVLKSGRSSCQEFRIKCGENKYKLVMDYCKPDDNDDHTGAVIAVLKKNKLKTV